MTLQENINHHLANLPEYLHAEILDFVLFLEYKHTAQPKDIARDNASLAQLLMDIPEVGRDEDFERIDETGSPANVFD
ncbi:DUF2281 domain-containing protein [Methylomagnum ishizawai]|uniref:DUF2281 domain-containing protein n=1 Tax=Methylomagnum ishizawai TaxID=1760988 RepID=UPI001C335F6B|nr:DUF2281 domain-containing protein [Methylomagnum ishizawai]BBL76261.1 hypothetical protein MishRS11D_33590 [Methylomagnum ishizawai]